MQIDRRQLGAYTRVIQHKLRTLSESRLTTSWLAEHRCTRTAEDDSLRMREDGGDSEAA